MRPPAALLIAISTFLIYCKGNQKPAAVFNLIMPKNERYDTLLRSLSKHYVLHIPSMGEHRNDLIRYYDKTPGQVAKDSLEYHNAAKTFYSADTSILSYLLMFRGNQNPCVFVGTPHPHSATIPRWYSSLTEERGAAVLIYDYLSYVPSTLPPILPRNIEAITDKYHLPLLEIWIKDNRGPLKEMREKFRRDSAYFPDQVKIHPYPGQ